MMNTKTLALLFVASMLVAACERTDSSHHKGVTESDQRAHSMNLTLPAPAVKADGDVADKSALHRENESTGDVSATPPAPAQPANTDTSKKVTKEGQLQFETADVNATRKQIIYKVQKLGGYVAEDSQTKDEGSGRKEYTLKIRIPAKNFDLLLDTISAAADKIDSRNVNIKDVTTEFIDTKARLDNKKKLEERYLQLLGKAAKMSDMLQIEDKLADIRGEIESTQGELNYLVKQVAYSSLDITFYSQPIMANTGGGILYKFRDALIGGWELLQNLFFGLLYTWPVVIAAILAFIYFRRRLKRKRVVITA